MKRLIALFLLGVVMGGGLYIGRCFALAREKERVIGVPYNQYYTNDKWMECDGVLRDRATFGGGLYEALSCHDI